MFGALSLINPAMRYNLALALFAVALRPVPALVRSRFGRVLVAIRENEARTRMLGYNTFRYKLLALGLSGAAGGRGGRAYALLFAYIGATFASIEYSILVLLWVLLGGAGTVLGPLVGALLMFYLVEWTSEVTAGLSPRGRRRAGAADPVLPQGHPRHLARTRLRWLP